MFFLFKKPEELFTWNMHLKLKETFSIALTQHLRISIEWQFLLTENDFILHRNFKTSVDNFGN